MKKAMKGGVKHYDGFTGIGDWTRSGPIPYPFHYSPLAQSTPKAGTGQGVGGGGTPRKPQCHGRSAFTSSVGYTYAAMTVSILWCGSQACLFFVNPLKVELDGKLARRPQCYYRSFLLWVLIWWVCKYGPALWRGTTFLAILFGRPEESFLIFRMICNLKQNVKIKINILCGTCACISHEDTIVHFS